MNLGGLIETTREYLDDIAAYSPNTDDLLFSDAQITAQLNRAQERFCELTGHLLGEFALAVQADVSDYELPSGTIAVVSVKLNDRFIPRYRAQALSGNYSGSVVGFETDVGMSVLRLVGKPVATDTLRILTQGYPQVAMAVDGDVPEIPPQWHLTLCDYAAAKLLRNANQDTNDSSKAGQFMASFMSDVKDAKSQFHAFAESGVRFGTPVNWTRKGGWQWHGGSWW